MASGFVVASGMPALPGVYNLSIRLLQLVSSKATPLVVMGRQRGCEEYIICGWRMKE